MFRRSRRRRRQGRRGRTIRFIHNNLDLLGVIATVILSYVAHFVERENNSDDISWQELLSIGLLPTASILGILAAAVDVFDEIPEQFRGNLELENHFVIDDPNEDHQQFSQTTRTQATRIARRSTAGESVLLGTLMVIVYFVRRATFRSSSNVSLGLFEITLSNPVNEHHILFTVESLFSFIEAIVYRYHSTPLQTLRDDAFNRFNYFRVQAEQHLAEQIATQRADVSQAASEGGTDGTTTAQTNEDNGTVEDEGEMETQEQQVQPSEALFFHRPRDPHSSTTATDMVIEDADAGSLDSLISEQDPLLSPDQDVDSDDKKEDNAHGSRPDRVG